MSEFKWEGRIDRDIEKNGIAFMVGTGAATVIQKFCTDLSDLVGYKCDWCYMGGRFVMKVLPEGLHAVKVALEDTQWFQRYVVDFGEKGENSHTYFMPQLLPVITEYN